MIGLGGGRPQRCHSYHVISWVYTINMTHPCRNWSGSRGWGNACQVSSLKCCSPPFLTLWKEVTIRSPRLRSGELCFPSLGWNIYILYLELLCMGDISVLSHLFIQSFISVQTHEYLFYSLCYNCLFCCSNCFSFGNWTSFSWLLCPFDEAQRLHHCGAFFLALPSFLVL